MEKKKILSNWNLPSTLEEFERRLKSRQKNSSTSEAKKEGQQEGTMTYEVKFVNNKKNIEEPDEEHVNLIKKLPSTKKGEEENKGIMGKSREIKTPIVVEYSDWNDNDLLNCPICEWQGKRDDCAQELYDTVSDFSCPKCNQMLLVVDYPKTKDKAEGEFIICSFWELDSNIQKEVIEKLRYINVGHNWWEPLVCDLDKIGNVSLLNGELVILRK
jgi:hypothetical protein